MQQTAKLQELTQNRLSTGLRVNSAIDNPSSYYTAAALNNRANDLSALLDAMSSGIQTLKAAQQGLQTASTFLEQAASIANQALETEPVPAKEWFEQQNNVAAVVTNETELLNAVNSSIKGEIVVYGKIDMSQTLSLKDGQNLVGVGYYGNFDTEVNKFSQLNFDFNKTNNGINISSKNTVLSDITVTGKLTLNQNVDMIKINSVSNTLKNINIEFDTQVASAINGIRGGSYEFHGINNINISASNEIGGNVTALSSNSVNMNNNATLNAHISAYRSLDGAIRSTLSVNDNAKINVKVDSIYFSSAISGTANFNGNSTINVDSYQGMNGTVSFNDNTQVTIKARDRSLDNGTYYFNSKSAKVYMSSHFWSAKLTFVAGASVSTRSNTYTAKMDTPQFTLAGDNPAQNMNSYFEPLPIPPLKSSDIIDYDNFNVLPEIKDSSSQKTSLQYDELLAQFDSIIKDSSYQGINLLQSNNLSINFNEDRFSKLEIKGIDASADKLGLKTKEWENKGDIAQSLSEIASALKQIRSHTQELGNYYSIVTTRENFTEKLINVLTEGADKLTLADMNEESANSLMLETRQNLAINALSLASQAGQSILKLF